MVTPSLPELFFGLVSPVGADSDGLAQLLANELAKVGFASRQIRLIEALPESDQWRNFSSQDVKLRYNARMDAGNAFRKIAKDCLSYTEELPPYFSGDAAFGLLATLEIQRLRASALDTGQGGRGVAYILRSLKREEEVEFLRKVYGKSFFVIAAYSGRDKRTTRLIEQIQHTGIASKSRTSIEAEAEALVSRDEREATGEHGQRLGDTFAKADFFVNVDKQAATKDAIDRYIRLLFADPAITPKIDEVMMFHAFGAAMRSSDLSRQVGAAIGTGQSVLATGTNEVPKFGGGVYEEDDDLDHRDTAKQFDSSHEMKRQGLTELLDVVLRELKKSFPKMGDLEPLIGDPEAIDQAAKTMFDKTIKTRLMGVLEYGRAVHAEMCAITEAARNGVRVQGATLYTTTFPCHLCARHIISAGISRVVYIEPYPKSLAVQQFGESISFDGANNSSVSFESYVGVSPTQYLRNMSSFCGQSSVGASLW